MVDDHILSCDHCHRDILDEAALDCQDCDLKFCSEECYEHHLDFCKEDEE